MEACRSAVPVGCPPTPSAALPCRSHLGAVEDCRGGGLSAKPGPLPCPGGGRPASADLRAHNLGRNTTGRLERPGASGPVRSACLSEAPDASGRTREVANNRGRAWAAERPWRRRWRRSMRPVGGRPGLPGSSRCRSSTWGRAGEAWAAGEAGGDDGGVSICRAWRKLTRGLPAGLAICRHQPGGRAWGPGRLERLSRRRWR